MSNGICVHLWFQFLLTCQHLKSIQKPKRIRYGLRLTPYGRPTFDARGYTDYPFYGDHAAA
jgi:hypothetical protein